MFDGRNRPIARAEENWNNMSIDFRYKHISNEQHLTKEELIRLLSSDFDILTVTTNPDNIVSYFAVNPKDKEKVIYEKGYEFHLQSDGRYWHPILTRDDAAFEKENVTINDIASNLNLELDLD